MRKIVVENGVVRATLKGHDVSWETEAIAEGWESVAASLEELLRVSYGREWEPDGYEPDHLIARAQAAADEIDGEVVSDEEGDAVLPAGAIP